MAWAILRASTSHGIYSLNTKVRRDRSSPSGHPEGHADAAPAPPELAARFPRSAGSAGAASRRERDSNPWASHAGGAGAVPAGSAGAQGTRLPPTAAAAARGAPRESAGIARAARCPPAAVRGAEGCDAHGGSAPPAPAGRRPRAGRRLPGRGVTGAAPAERYAG